MRTAIVVVVGAALLGGAATALADDAGLSRSEMVYCSERCETDYSACMRRHTGKGTEDCPGTLMRCRGTCDPAGAATRSAAAKRAGLSCPEACQADYDGCVRTDNGKNGPACAKNVMVCRKNCPTGPTRAVGVSEPSTEAPTVSHSKVPSSGSAEPRRVSAPPTAERGPAPGVRQEPPPTAAAPAVPPRVAVAESPPADTAPLRDAAPPPVVAEDDAAAAFTPPRRPSMWSRFWCAASGSCGTSAASNAPLSCPDACARDYDTCLAHENPKRGSGCAAASMRCRQGCADKTEAR